LSSNSVEAYLYHATARMNQGDAPGAETDLNNLLKLTPDSPMPYIKLALLRGAQKRWNDAESLYKQALSHDANSIDAVKGLAAVYVATNKSAEALKFLQEQISHNPNSSVLYLVQGEILLQSRQNEPAEAVLSHAVELDHSNASAFLLLAQAQTSLNKNDAAVNNYQKAIELSPRDPRLLLVLGGLYEKTGDWQRARDNYQTALSIQPEDAITSNNLAYLLLEHNGDVTVALSLAQIARKGLPNYPSTGDTLGWAYYHNRAYSAAVPLFEGAVKAAPNNQTYRYHLGLTYQKLQDPSRAKAELEKAISIDPKSPVADRARRTINELTAS